MELAIMSQTATKEAGEKFCHECGVAINVKAEICPKCGVRLQTQLRPLHQTEKVNLQPLYLLYS